MKINFRPIVYMRDRTHTYLWVRDGRGDYGYFLTMDPGTIELVKIPKEDGTYRVWQDKEHSWDLVPYAYDPMKAFWKYHDSLLDRSPAAERELCAILDCEPRKVKPKPIAATQAAAAAKRGTPPPGSDYSLTQLCQELGIDPSDARKTLRRKGVEKPGSQWAWATSEAAEAARKALK